MWKNKSFLIPFGFFTLFFVVLMLLAGAVQSKLVTDQKNVYDLIENSVGDVRIVIFYFASVFFLPFILLFAVNGSLSVDNEAGFFRFLSNKIARWKIFLAKYFSELVSIFVALFLVILILLGFSFDRLSGNFLLGLLKSTIFILFYSSAIVAFYLIFDVITKSRKLNLLLTIVGFVFMMWLSSLDFFSSFLIFGSTPNILELSLGAVLIKSLIMLVTATVFVFLGIWIFNRREL
ncbi:hypothetical protein K9L97_05955 [Candidatus Woesearchaeota archaeon]|nr:hypothetical protein [Candidatus Woesearchaeota archaeon]